MKIILLLSVLFNQEAFLVKQDDVAVNLSELDAYVLTMSEKDRIHFAGSKKSIESSIFTLLNVNIVNQHISASGLDELEVFEQIKNKEFTPVSEDRIKEFSSILDVDVELLKSSLHDFQIENENYRTLLSYLDQKTTEKLVPLANEHYLINKKDYSKPEKRDISVIVLENKPESQISNVTLLNKLNGASKDEFEKHAEDFSIDVNVALNNGHWGEYRLSDFRYDFAESVFQSKVGVVNNLYVYEGQAYIVRVNSIKPAKTFEFVDVKDEIINELKGKTVTNEFQSIINKKSLHKVEVNAELVAHVFERYKAFNQE